MNRSLILLLLCLLAISCTEKEPVVLATGSFPLTLQAEMPEMPYGELSDDNTDTKATAQYTVRIKWVAGDQLSAINLTTGKMLGGCLTANSSGTSTTFSGTLTGTVNQGDRIAFVYPAQNHSEESDFTGIHIDMSEQLGTMNGVPLCVCSTTTANSASFDRLNLSFSFLMGYIMIGLSDMPASTTIKHVRITNVTNTFDLSINNGRTGFDITPQIGDIVLSPNQTSSATGVRTVYAAVPASAGATRSLILETPLTSFEVAFTSASLQNAYAYNTNVSGFLVDDLSFADEKVRAYCFSHFDTNGDGKLSMVEIAGVTAFPDQATDPLPSGISSFNELEYFYGLTSLPSFQNQKQLESITIPRQITSIPDNLFSGCSSLVKIYLKPSVPPALGNNVFNGMPDGFMLIAADAVVADYQSADGWSEYFDHFRTESNQSDANININPEDGQMGSERIDINVG